MRAAAPGAGVGAVEVTPATLDVPGLAPGAAAARDVTVVNGSGVPVVVTVTTTQHGALFGGATPLSLATTWATDGPTCDGLPVVPAGDTADLALRVELPADAGNDYQGLAGSAVVRVTATELPAGVCAGLGDALAAPPGGGPLALTGTEAGALLVTVLVLVAAGCALLLRRRHDRAGVADGPAASQVPA